MPPPLRRGVAAFLGCLFASALGAHPSTLHAPLLAQATPAAADAATIPLTLEITRGDNPEPVAAVVRITSLSTNRPVALTEHLRRPMNWFSLPPRATIKVPPGDLRIEAFHGVDTELATRTHNAVPGAPDETLRIPLRRFYDAAEQGVFAVNTHVHLHLQSQPGMQVARLRSRREAEEHLLTVSRSDGLDVVCVSHLERSGETGRYVSNEFSAADFARWSDRTLRFVAGEEHRHEGGRFHRRGGPGELRYGHVLFLNLPQLVQPASYGAVFTPDSSPSDAIPLRRAIAAARAQDATIVWCHGKQGTEDLPNWIAGLLHAQNIYDGGNDGTFDTLFYPYLDAGFRVPFSTGTDWGIYDLSRVFVAFDGEPSSRDLLAALARGRSFISNGTLLEFSVEGHAPGDTIALPAAGRVQVRARGLGRDDFARLEIVFNGAVVARADARRREGHFEAELEEVISVPEPGWLALRIPTTRPYSDRTQYIGEGANAFGKALFAHTSAMYVDVAGRSVCRPAAIRSLLAELETAITAITSRGAFADDSERERLLALYREAIRSLESRLAAAR